MIIEKGEKDSAQLLPQPTVVAAPPPPSACRNPRARGLIIFAAACLSVVQLLGYIDFWRRYSSSSTLAWTPCPDGDTTLCSFLTVPLDYTNPRPNETVSLALRKLPATAPRSERLGTLFINPGGPGGSGHAAVVRFGQKLSVILQGKYDILSWDPRGVNLTSPALSCFETNGDAARFNRDVEHIGLPFEVGGASYFSGYESDAASVAERGWMEKLDAFQSALGGACEYRGNEALLRASSTAFVVRDMKSILEALGEEKLSYWGFSYGTILGATFSAMFPELVHRVVLDGVSDSVSYTNNMWDWGRSGMNDTHRAWKGFLDGCAESGPSGCALAEGNNDAAASIDYRVQKLLHDLRVKPVAVPVSKVGPGIVGPSDVQYAIFNTLYAPKLWPQTAQAFADLEKGNGTLLYELQNGANDDLARSDPTANVYGRSMETSMSVATTAAIMCGDSDPTALKDKSTETYMSYMRELAEKSPTGDIWSIWVGTCRRWTAKAIETYRGPWTTAEGLRKTNFPILFASMTADPVTPLSAARSMSLGFGHESASLLIQEGFGHCTLAHPSLCTAKTIRSYFVDGVVPPYGTTCASDPGFIFPNSTSTAELGALTLSREDEELRKALEALSGEVQHLALKPPRARSFDTQ